MYEYSTRNTTFSAKRHCWWMQLMFWFIVDIKVFVQIFTESTYMSNLFTGMGKKSCLYCHHFWPTLYVTASKEGWWFASVQVYW